MLSITGEQCCHAPQIKDLSQGQANSGTFTAQDARPIHTGVCSTPGVSGMSGLTVSRRTKHDPDNKTNNHPSR